MNPRLQAKKIKQKLRSRGYAADAIDVLARLDSTLTYRENEREVMRFAPVMKELSGSKRNASYYDQAASRHAKRSKRSISMDEQRQARAQYDPTSMSSAEYRRWKKNPNRYDLIGVDDQSVFRLTDFAPVKRYGPSRGWE